ALGIPTTRSLAVVATGVQVRRETPQPGAILTRVAASHVRVGTFAYFAARGHTALLRALLAYCIDRHDPQLRDAGDAQPLEFLRAVAARQATLIADWTSVGFIHGVMNTDNMTLSGETIDYGPCAFMDHYHPDTVFSSIDHQGRYAYGNQPAITQWNLTRFAETLLPLIDTDTDTAVQKAPNVIRSFSGRYDAKWLAMMRAKLGLFGDDPVDATLIQDLLDWMQRRQADYTNTFRDLIGETAPVDGIYQDEAFENWHQRWQARLSRNAK